MGMSSGTSSVLMVMEFPSQPARLPLPLPCPFRDRIGIGRWLTGTEVGKLSEVRVGKENPLQQESGSLSMARYRSARWFANPLTSCLSFEKPNMKKARLNNWNLKCLAMHSKMQLESRSFLRNLDPVTPRLSAPQARIFKRAAPRRSRSLSHRGA